MGSVLLKRALENSYQARDSYSSEWEVNNSLKVHTFTTYSEAMECQVDGIETIKTKAIWQKSVFRETYSKRSVPNCLCKKRQPVKYCLIMVSMVINQLNAL